MKKILSLLFALAICLPSLALMPVPDDPDPGNGGGGSGDNNLTNYYVSGHIMYQMPDGTLTPAVDMDIFVYTPEEHMNIYTDGSGFFELPYTNSRTYIIPFDINKKITIYGCSYIFIIYNDNGLVSVTKS